MRVVRYYPRALTGDGGMTGAVRTWAQTAAQLGADVVVAHDGGAPPAGDGVRWLPVPHRGRDLFRMPVGVKGMLERNDVLVLHSGWTLHNVRAGAAARRRSVPYILEPRGAYDARIFGRYAPVKRTWWRFLEAPLVQNALAVHCFFDEQAGHLRDVGYSGPVIVAPNGVKPASLAWNGSSEHLLWMGRFDVEHKGLDLLVEAIASMPKGERPPVRLHGPDRRGGKRRVRELIARLGLASWVSVEEPVYGDAKYEALAAARAFVYPSRWEGFGNSVAEAASVGVPILATPYPLGRFLAARDAAIVAEAKADALAAGIREVLDERSRSLGSRAALVAAEELSWESVVRSWLTQAGSLL